MYNVDSSSSDKAMQATAANRGKRPSYGSQYDYTGSLRYVWSLL